MNTAISEGDRIILELNTSDIFEASLHKITDSRIDVEDVICEASRNKIPGVLSFYKKEIKKISVLKNKKLETKNTTSEMSKDIENGIKIPKDEYYRLKDMAREYTYIRCDDKNYYDAVEYISNAESVGIFAIGGERGRTGKISILCISTWKKVYIFDFKLMRCKSIFPKLKEILESEYILKVIHGGGPLIDCLQYSHNVQVSNVFDTQVADMLIIKNRTGSCSSKLRSLPECLTSYFNFPLSLLDSAMVSVQNSWDVRPLEEEQKTKIARLVIYLISLKDHLQRLMLENYFEAVTNVHFLYTKASAFEMNRRSVSLDCDKNIEDLIPLQPMKNLKIDS